MFDELFFQRSDSDAKYGNYLDQDTLFPKSARTGSVSFFIWMHIFIMFFIFFWEMLVLHLGFPRPRWWLVGRRRCQGSCPATGSEWPRLSHQDTQPIYQCWVSTRFCYGPGSPYRNVSFYLYFIYTVRVAVRFYFHVSYQNLEQNLLIGNHVLDLKQKSDGLKLYLTISHCFLIWNFKYINAQFMGMGGVVAPPPDPNLPPKHCQSAYQPLGGGGGGGDWKVKPCPLKMTACIKNTEEAIIHKHTQNDDSNKRSKSYGLIPLVSI